tara:strand:+ start:472 stop:1194 length:723 start_codon:yes stop_codon:yes gene_type:complete
MLVEICANSLESAINAEKAGADRIELCAELGVGGITPSFGLMKAVKEKIKIPIHVLIRPRSGNFTYSTEEFETMLLDIEQCKQLEMDGIVCGVLLPDLTLDKMRTRELLKISKNLKFTFHRAFDWVKDPVNTFQKLQDFGIDHVLSSGQKPTAIEGLALLKELLSKSDNCKIIPGSGINNENILQFKNAGFKEIHFSGTNFRPSLETLPEISMNSYKFLREDLVAYSDPVTIAEIINQIK